MEAGLIALYIIGGTLGVLVAYGLLVVAIFLAIFLTGLLGKAETRLPSGVRQVFRVLVAPLYGFRLIEATTVGYATVFYGPVRPVPQDLVDHEAFHRFQSTREIPWRAPWGTRRVLGAVIYGWKYLKEFVKVGYYNNRFEREARVAAGQE